MLWRYRVDSLLKSFEKTYATHNRIEVSGEALRHNLQFFAETTGKHVIPVLKGNAYGHGTELVARALNDQPVPYVAVDGYFEALRIRNVSKLPVLIMGAIKEENYRRLRYDGFAFVVESEASIRALGRTGKKIKVHLEVNTGMNRYGADPDKVGQLTALILQHRNLELEGVMSHLADSDGTDDKTVRDAVAAFDASVEAARAAGANPNMLHVAQSAGGLRAQSKYATTIRLGIGLYGCSPFPAGHPLNRKLARLRPALKLVSTITKTTDLKKGDRVSYNYTFTAPKAMKIGVLPLGYYEGIDRRLSNAGMVKIDTAYVPIVGRVCMNHTMVNLEGTGASVGDEVVVYSNQPGDRTTIDSLAAEHQLFNYSMLTSLSPDVRRVLVD